MPHWIQLEFEFVFDEPKKKKKYVDYNALIAQLKKGPMTFREIQEFLGLSRSSTQLAITTLSVNYPVWTPSRGLYKLCEASDYATSPKDAPQYDEDGS